MHFPLWIIKDAAWFSSLHYEAYKDIFQYISLVFAMPTILISFFLILLSGSRFQRLEHVVIGVWLLANSFWMISELFEFDISWMALLFFSIGFVLIPFYFYFLNKDKNVINQRSSG